MVKAIRGCREEAVLVAVYAEMPRRQLLLKDDRQGGHHHHYHHFRQNDARSDGRVRGYNRRAELLDYARHLRASAQPNAASASFSSHPFSHIGQLSIQISTADRKRKHSSLPACLGKWECLIPSFLRSRRALNASNNKGKRNHRKSVSSANKMKAFVKNLHVSWRALHESRRSNSVS